MTPLYKLTATIRKAVLDAFDETDMRVLCEMAYDRKSFKSHIHSYALHLYRTLINVVVLETIFPEMVEHWCKEIYAATSFIIEDKTTSKFARAPLVKSELMRPQMGEGFEDYDVSSFNDAIMCEIKKAESEKNPIAKTSKQHEADIIKHQILPNLNSFFKDQEIKSRLQTFYHDLHNAVEHGEIDELKYAINKFAKRPYFEI